MTKLKTIKRHRLHNEGRTTLFLSGSAFIIVAVLSYWLLIEACPLCFYLIVAVLTIVYGIIVNFFRCPLRIFMGETENVVVAPADGRVVVIEEVEENEYFRDRRLMVSVFMSVTNVHANWFPVAGKVKLVRHHNGNFHKAWLPKASTENERSTVVISTPSGHDVLVRQVAGAVARRIVTYAEEGQTCDIDNHMGFIKFGSRVDVYLPVGTEIDVALGQATTGNATVLGYLTPVKTSDNPA
ncbi:phosphatidylserine decarboxylase family protein [Alloprevotella sp. OH1205_COT-284]|uniref:phosphatidylserine decarboxylase family protein n=1 Tax=Alloprevotella sp. OH1205_COT-284 TaxID=2491043 RepID=UPI000F5FB7E9|nr:phosphatidylserine decarboxylase family protein [Alloprevotella sp. OH1205_COT-284]RRD78270.1 phosphatidylserine decarboxylase family protein [Alloprevotella sp. OH1205_COT-284]